MADGEATAVGRGDGVAAAFVHPPMNRPSATMTATALTVRFTANLLSSLVNATRPDRRGVATSVAPAEEVETDAYAFKAVAKDRAVKTSDRGVPSVIHDDHAATAPRT